MREGILALALEWRFSKDQILELYLNRVYFGGGAYGIDAASRRFFGHSATELQHRRGGDHRRPGQGAVQLFADRRRRGRAQPRRRRARPDGPRTARSPRPRRQPPIRRTSSSPATAERQNITRYFTDWVLPQLDMLIDETVQPIDVWTTIDLGMQRAAVAAINANAPRGAQGALVSLDRDGAVRAMVGGRDYVNSSYNRATQANRQPGSSFKLFVYLTALEAGYRPDNDGRGRADHDRRLEPRNDNGRYAGPVPVRAGLRLFDQHRRGPARPGGRHPRGRRHGAALRHHHPGRHQSVDGAGLVRGAADRHDPRLCRRSRAAASR